MIKFTQENSQGKSPTDSLIDLVLVDSPNEETVTLDESHPIDLSPQSPHDPEKASQPPEYVPKSEVNSILDLEIPGTQCHQLKKTI